MPTAEREWLRLRAGAKGLDPKGTMEAGLAGPGNQLTDHGRDSHLYLAF